MLLDVLLVIFIITGFINGYRKGLIYSIFAFISLFLGIMLAMEYGYLLSNHLYQEAITQSKLLPFINFLIILLNRAGGNENLLQTCTVSLLWASILVLLYSTIL